MSSSKAKIHPRFEISKFFMLFSIIIFTLPLPSILVSGLITGKFQTSTLHFGNSMDIKYTLGIKYAGLQNIITGIKLYSWQGFTMTRKQRTEAILKYFLENRPVAETELRYSNAYELLVAVILSAQCTDKRVNMITPAFFRRFPDLASLAAARKEDVFELVKSCSYPNNKSNHLLGMAQYVIRNFKGEIPGDVNLLQEIPGVGRKTANVIAAVIFNQPAMAVDTHVFRVSARLGLTHQARNPLDTELQLVKQIPPQLIPIAHHWLILHGRYICKARIPLCDTCGLTKLCKYYSAGKGLPAGEIQNQKKREALQNEAKPGSRKRKE